MTVFERIVSGSFKANSMPRVFKQQIENSKEVNFPSINMK